MGGKMELESEAGKGAIFRFSLPVREVVDSKEIRKIQQSSFSTGTSLKKLPVSGRILIAEDYEVNQNVIRMHLNELGLRNITIVDNGEKAVEEIKNGSYDMVFMDLQMPVMDGYRAAEMIRALPGGKSLVPIIAVTAHANKEVRAEVMAAKMNGVITKPFLPENISSIISRYIAVNTPARVTEPETPQDDTPDTHEYTDKDYEYAKTLFGGQDELLRASMRVLFKTLPGQVGKMRAAMDSGDTETLRKEAHKIRGGSALVGAKRISAWARIVEEKSEGKQARADKRDLDALEDAIKNVKTYWKNHIKEA